MATGIFNGVSFDILMEPITRPAGTDYTERHIPGGDVTYIDYAGKKLDHVTVVAYCLTPTIYLNLKASRGVSGTLVYIDGSLLALLVDVNRTLLYPGGDSESTLEFVLL